MRGFLFLVTIDVSLAMGVVNSTVATEADKVGFHVVQVQPNSPGALAGLVSFFDFIVAANGVPLVSACVAFSLFGRARGDGDDDNNNTHATHAAAVCCYGFLRRRNWGALAPRVCVAIAAAACMYGCAARVRDCVPVRVRGRACAGVRAHAKARGCLRCTAMTIRRCWFFRGRNVGVRCMRHAQSRRAPPLVNRPAREFHTDMYLQLRGAES